MNTTLVNQQFKLALSPTEHYEPIKNWVDELQSNDFYRSIIESQAFARLKKISFLGAIDHLASENKLKKSPRSRAEHSINVAALVSFIVDKRKYDADLSKHLIVAGLLHDIGHPPLSHSVEPYLKQHFGFGHHEMGQMLIKGKHRISIKLHEQLSQEVDVDFIEQLIAGKVSDALGGDLFSSPINVDTIDGIIRAIGYCTKAPLQLKPIDIAYASFIEKDDSRLDLLDTFWRLKGLVYRHMINAERGVLADQYSQAYFSDTQAKPLNEEDLFETENIWKHKYTPLFDNLKQINLVKRELADRSCGQLNFIDRNYVINKELKTFARFKTTKITKTLTLDTKDRSTNQLNFVSKLHFG